MKSNIIVKAFLSVALLSIMNCHTACSGVDKEGNSDVDSAQDGQEDAVYVDIPETGFVPCPDGELTLEHIKWMHTRWCEKVDLGPNGQCGNVDDDRSPQCFCDYYDPTSPSYLKWGCYESWPYDSDAY